MQMNTKRIISKKLVTKRKNKVYSCSTPERTLDSPSRDSDSICDSESASPVPFLCTQDGAEGETDVVWNFYTPKSETAKSQLKNTTPVSRRFKKIRSILIDKPIIKRRAVKPSQKKTELVQELRELNQNLHEYFSNKPSVTTDVNNPQSEDDIFSDASDNSPRTYKKSKNRCLRKNILSSKFPKVEPENCLESDDSMNECLLKASQVVEEHLLNVQSKLLKRPDHEPVLKSVKSSKSVNIDNDSMDAILNSIKLDSPSIYKMKKYDTPALSNDSFDRLLGNLNDSTFEKLSQMPVKNKSHKNSNNCREDSWVLKEFTVCEGSPLSKSIFGRYNSMPESPTVASNKPSTSGMILGRYNSMPFNTSDEKITVPGDSPIRCTPDEIEKKRKQAREKLLAKRLLPFTTSQQSSQCLLSQNQPAAKKASFQLKVPSNKISSVEKKSESDVDLKLIIEKKRQEALMKLRKKLQQTK